MDPIEILMHGHQRVKALFAEVRATDDIGLRITLFQRIKFELEGHLWIEDTVFYPEYARVPGFKDLIVDSREDHQEIKELIASIDADADADDIDMDLEDLMQAAEQHFEEEELELFPRVRESTPDSELSALGDRMFEARRARGDASQRAA